MSTLVENGLVCHGRPIGTGALNGGQRYWHAWVEYPDGNGWSVLDGAKWRATRAAIVARRSAYYRAGHIDGDDVLRFTAAEALEALEHYGHAGPWCDYDEDEL